MPTNGRIVAVVMVALVCTAVLGGCCSLGLKTCDVTDELTLKGDRDLNNCNDESSIPVEVHVYYLKQDNNFLTSNFKNLWNEPNETLGSEMIGEKSFRTVKPSGKESIFMVRPAEAAYIGVIANFCEDNGAGRTLIKLNKKELVKTVNLYQMSLSKD